MREIRKSGLTRGSNGFGVSHPLLSTLLVNLVENTSVIFLSCFKSMGT